ncbi:MAG TPA: HAMP domain-containing sensor histidine kinase [Sphingomonas sp.]
MTRRAGRRLPLFMRIFAVMLAGVLGAQALDFGLLLLTPPPEPHLYAMAEVAAALRGQPATAATYRVKEVAVPPASDGGRRQEWLRAALAARLGVAPDAVQLELPRPPLFDGPPLGRRFGHHPPRDDDGGRQPHEFLFGHFAASLKLADGRWRVVRPAALGVEPWHWRMLLWLAGSLFAVAPFAWLVSRRVAKPIGLFAAAADRIGRDPRGSPMAVDGPPEVALAATAFNEMQARIRRYVDDRVTMAAAIAHDLRTPLMRLALRVEKVPMPVRAEIEADIVEMKDMIGAALAFVRDTARPLRRQRLSLRALVESVADSMVDMGADVAVASGPDIVVEADVSAVKTLVANLVGNAVKFAGAARITIARVDGQAEIAVSDDGPGVPEAQIDRLFEPFYRLEPSRNRETGGSGLGLASARAVARAHGGDVTIANRAQGGLLARAVLPL